MADQVISLKEAVQRRLAAQMAADPELQSVLETDPGSVVKPLIAELTGDDGSIDLSDATTTVHIETGNDLHFVITPDAQDLDEVSGFGAGSIASMMSSFSLGIDSAGMSGFKKSTETKRCTNEGDGKTRGCCLESTGATTHKNCAGA